MTREQLAMTAVLMSYQACRHPLALTKKPLTLSQVLSSPSIAPCTSLLECARRADGGAAILVASSRFITRMGFDDRPAPIIVGGGEASGPLYPPDVITEDMFSCEEATQSAYDELSIYLYILIFLILYYSYTRAQLGVHDIDFFGLYDCFPICLIRAIEAVHVIIFS